MNAVRIGDCTLETRLGAGGMGEVWRATHASSGRAVAVKLIKSADQTSADQLLAEAAAMARLDHPGIAWVYEFGTLDAPCGTLPAGTPWMALELATGGSLADIREGLAWSDLRDVLLDLLDALAHAHAHGLIHRDLKPANVLVCSTDDPRPGLKIADFGIARLRWDQREPLWAGTPVFMAPEQVRGEWRRFGPWTDV